MDDSKPKRRIRTTREWNADRFSKSSDFGATTAVSEMTDLSFSEPSTKRRARSSIRLILLLAVAFTLCAIHSSIKLSRNDLNLQDKLGQFTPMEQKQSNTFPRRDADSNTLIDRALAFDASAQTYDAPLQMKGEDNLALVVNSLDLGVHPEGETTTEDASSQKSKPKPAQVLSSALLQCSKLLRNPTSINEMTYWDKTQPNDYEFTAETFNTNKFLSFEPDTGGWNSQHLVFESMVVLALSLGRTLVLPPKRRATPTAKMIQSYDELMNLNATALSKKYKGVKIISTDAFLKFVAVPGHLVKDKKRLKPPNNRINWDSAKDIGNLYNYLRTVAYVPREWDPQTCILAIGRQTENVKKALISMWTTKEDRREAPYHLHFQGKPTPVNAPLVERLREFVADRQALCTYEGPMIAASLLHIPTTKEGKSLLFSPFYSFLFHSDYREDLLMKRLVRNEMHFNDEIVCAAARIVDALKTMGGGTFHAFHIRSIAYENAHHDVHEDPQWIMMEIQGVVPKNSTVFVSTDEANKGYFAVLATEYNLYFASDFRAQYLASLNPGYLELVQQLVCARSEIFVGTFYSSFSGYINRMRGYYSTREESPGYEEGALNSYYHSPTTMKKEMRMYRAMRKPFHFREWPTAWRDIDRQ
jgi:hypothetical protein